MKLIILSLFLLSFNLYGEESIDYAYSYEKDGKLYLNGDFEMDRPVVLLNSEGGGQCNGVTGKKSFHSDEVVYFKRTEVVKHNCNIGKKEWKVLCLVGKSKVEYKPIPIESLPVEKGQGLYDKIKKEKLFEKYLEEVGDNGFSRDGKVFKWTIENAKQIKVKKYFVLDYQGIKIPFIQLSYIINTKETGDWNYDDGPVFYFLDLTPKILNGMYSIHKHLDFFTIDGVLFIKVISSCSDCGAYASKVYKLEKNKLIEIYWNGDWQT